MGCCALMCTDNGLMQYRINVKGMVLIPVKIN